MLWGRLGLAHSKLMLMPSMGLVCGQGIVFLFIFNNFCFFETRSYSIA